MRRTPVMLSALGAIAFGTASIAAPADQFEQVDTNKDGIVTWEEASLFHTDWSEDQFWTFDADKDGTVDKQEYIDRVGGDAWPKTAGEDS